MTHPQEGGTGGEVSEILFFSAKSKRHPSLIYSMQIIPVCLSIVARRKGVSATRRGGLNWTPISLLVGHPCKLFHKSGAFKCRPRDQWIGWKRELLFTRLHLIANNTRFLIPGAPGCFPNLASFALAAMVQRLSADWSAAYGHSLLLAETSVDPSRFCGHMYKAAGWTRLGRTKVYARTNGRYTDPHGVPKDLHVFHCTAIPEVVYVPRILFPTPCCRTR